MSIKIRTHQEPPFNPVPLANELKKQENLNEMARIIEETNKIEPRK